MREKSVTQADVARRAGVSRAVVSYVVNNGPRVVSEELRRRVLQAIEELGYRPNKYAQGLKLSRAKQARGQIGIIMGGDSDILRRPYFSAMLAALYREIHQRGRQIRLVTFFDELNDPVFFNKNIHPEEISGLILFTPYKVLKMPQADALLRRIIDRIDNIVCLETVIADLPAVIFDRAAAARTVVQHLIGLGHQRIGFAGFPDERLDGYRQALLQHGLNYQARLVQSQAEYNWPEEGYAAVGRLMALDQPPTAIFAVSDEVALGALAALHDHGLRVPEDVAIGSIDDLGFARMVRPALTTVHVPIESFATYALRMLETHEHYPNSHPASVVLPTELIVRESCGARLRQRAADG